MQASGKGNVEVLFSGDGCGMGLGVWRQAFDPFFTTRHDQGGTGLGLHIVYSIVTNCLGGRLNRDSEPWRGDEIQLVLPRGHRQGLPLNSAFVGQRSDTRGSFWQFQALSDIEALEPVHIFREDNSIGTGKIVLSKSGRS